MNDVQPRLARVRAGGAPGGTRTPSLLIPSQPGPSGVRPLTVGQPCAGCHPLLLGACGRAPLNPSRSDAATLPEDSAGDERVTWTHPADRVRQEPPGRYRNPVVGAGWGVAGQGLTAAPGDDVPLLQGPAPCHPRYPAGAPVPRERRPGTGTIVVTPRVVSTQRVPHSEQSPFRPSRRMMMTRVPPQTGHALDFTQVLPSRSRHRVVVLPSWRPRVPRTPPPHP